MTRDPAFPDRHRAVYADQLPPAPPSRTTRALRRLRALLRTNRNTR